MSKILLVEPDNMLRQAFAVALFPEHQVVLAVDALPQSLPKEVELVIIDGAAAKNVRVGNLCHLPLIWIGDDSAARLPDRCDVVRLPAPVAKEALRQAVAQCLEARAASAETLKPRSKAVTEVNHGAREHGRFIELVDVVEASAESDDAKAIR